MTLSGSIWYTEGPMVRVEGALPKAAADLIVTKGGFYNAGAWWVKRDNWPSVKSTLELMGIAVGTGLLTAPSKVAEFTTTSMGEIAIYGDMPRNLDPTWLGRTRARGYFGLSPWALEDAIAAFRKEGIEARLDVKVQSILDDVNARKEAAEGVLEGPLPIVQLANGDLWEFQRETIAFAAATGGNCLNADEPGLGKSVQGIAVARYFDAKRIVILGPAISKFKWGQEIAKFDGSEAFIVEGKRNVQIPKTAKFVVLNYDILPDHLTTLTRWDPDMVIMDESHLLKNREAKRTQAAKALSKHPSVRFRFPMTGTPIWNNVIDLWSQLDMVQDNWWGHPFEFGIAFANGRKDRFGWQFKGSSNEPILNQRLKYVMTRHLKKDVLKDLPMKTRVMFPVALQDQFARQYAEKWKEFTRKGKEISGSPEDVNVSKQRGQLLAMLQQLRMLSSQGRVASTIEYVKEALEEQRATVVFCYFTEAIDALNAALRQSDVRVAVIDGSVPPGRRQQIADEFQAGKLDVIVGQVQAAGTAIDLFRSDLTVHHDISWVPSEQVQAEDRVNRMGQKRGTEHVYMVGRETVDQRVIDKLLKKMAAAKSILDLGEPMDEEALREIEQEFFG